MQSASHQQGNTAHNMTINDPRFNSIHNDPRFIKPTRKKQKQEQEQDNRFTHIKDSSKKKTKKDILPTLIDYARGRVILESSDDDDDEEEEEEEEEQEEESDDEDVELGPTGPKRAQEIDLNEDEEEEEETPQHINPTHRIAIVNLDWDNLKPLDIYKVFSSLLVPPHQTPLTTTADSKPTTEHKTVQGAVKRVCFYKSEFGKRRMAEEDVQGPPREIFNTTNKKLVGNDDDDEEEEEDLDNEDRGAEFDELALRKYQLDRLRYFYAIVELDSAQSAQHVFSEIDGTEFERTANIFDLSYVPDDMAFDEADLWDECTQDSNDYKGVDFSTDVLRHSKVKLTWDSEDPVRRKYTRLNTQKLTQEELDELDFKAFIASGSSGPESGGGSEEEEEEGSGRRQDGGRLRTLLGLTEDAGGQATMEGQEELDITFKPGFVDLPSPAPAPVEEPVPRPKKSRNQRTKDKLKDKQEAEPGATRRDKQAELELLMMDDLSGSGPTDPISSQNPRHFDLAQILKHEKLATGTKKNKKKKNKNKSLDPSRESDSHQKHEEDLVDLFAMDQDDSRFAPALVHDPEFAIDPSNPHFKKTKNMLGLLSSTRAKRAPTHSPNTPTTGAPKNHSSLPASSLLPTSTAQLLRNLKHSRTDTRAKRVRIE